MKIPRIILAFFAVIILASCTAVAENTADEVRSGSWEARLSGDSRVSLNFSGDRGVFEVDSGDRNASVRISGLCVMDEKSMMFCDSADSEVYKLSYKLKNNRLRLTYEGSSVTLIRKN